MQPSVTEAMATVVAAEAPGRMIMALSKRSFQDISIHYGRYI